MPEQFLVGVKIVVANDRGEFLLVNAPDRGWEVPGGGIEPGEDLLQGLARELMEETGVTATVDSVCGIYTNHCPPQRLMVWFRGTYIEGDLSPSEESPELGWFTREEALDAITAIPVRDRFFDALAPTGPITYRAFSAESPTYSNYQLFKTIVIGSGGA